jgi:putative ABC transport system ATP-binding protein
VPSGIERPTSGRVRIGGVELDCLGEKGLAVLRRRRVGFVFQQVNLVEALTAEQNVALPLRLDGRRPKRGVARAALERVGLGEHACRSDPRVPGGPSRR